MARIKTHPFFRGVDFTALRSIRAPFVPHLTSITDTSYFPTEDLANVPQDVGGMMMDTTGDGSATAGGTGGAGAASKDLAFVGYTFKRWETVRGEL